MAIRSSMVYNSKQLTFNIENIEEHQNITFTRVKNGSKTTLNPIFIGGGFDLVSAEMYSLSIE